MNKFLNEMKKDLRGHGRIGRLRFLLYRAIILPLFLGSLYYTSESYHTYSYVFEGDNYFEIALFSACLAILCLVCASFFYFVLKNTILRFHDFGYSGCTVIFIGIPYVGWMIDLLLYFIPGSKSANTYGEPNQYPKKNTEIS